MKKLNIFLFIFCLLGLFSCENETLVKINPKAEDGSLKFHLNKSVYADWTYVLEDANANKDMDSLTCVQPDYGFTAAVSYSTQVCFDSLFSAGTFQTLSTTVNGEKVGINTKEMDKAIIALYGGKLPEPVVAKTLYIRLMAVINSATHSALSDSLIVKPLYSNAIALKIKPYVLPLFPYTEVTPKLWYIIGLGDAKWTNSVSAIGVSLIPLSIQNGKKYNLSGDGEFTYTGYFSKANSFKIIGPNLKWDGTQWGMKGSTYGQGDAGNDNIVVPSDGYYTITLNSIEKTLTIVPASITPPSYSKIGLIGAFNGWAADVALTPTAGTNGHVWYTTYTFATDSQCKLRANADWGTNWGTASSSDGDPLYSAMGVSVGGGKNMLETAGTYIVVLNDIDGTYYFIKQ